MKSLKLLMTFVFILGTLNACTGAGTTAGSTGAAGLSLQLEELETGESYQTEDAYTLEFTTFALTFSKITLGEQETSESFTADFADEEAVDVVEVEDVPAGEYDEVTLTLETASIVATATSGSDTCTLQIELTSDETITVNPAGNDVDIEAGEESELLVEVDPNQIFGTIGLPDTCTGGTTLTISSTENTALADSILDNLINNDAFSLGETTGHAH